MSSVHQFLPTWEPGAVGAHAIAVQETLRAYGVASEIFADDRKTGLPVDAHPYRAYGAEIRAAPDDVLLYHVAIGSDVARFVAGCEQRLVVDYHNVTPPEYFDAWDTRIGENLELGRDQLRGLASRTSLALADSGFNADELVGLGFGRVCVVPILLDVDGLVGASPARVGWPGGGARWLFVGRVAPNKAQHDVVKAFAWYRRVFDAGASLTLVGGVSAGSYWEALSRFVDELGLGGAVRLAGSVSDAELEGLYRSADVFVCLSEHEGFCVPLLEAMAHEVPVVALGAAAVPETLGDGGLVLASKRPSLVAEAVARVVGDEVLRAGLVAAGRRRLERFALPRTRRRLLDALTPLLEGSANP
jgi:glycosyltransferase involved in cell wall biosynthesis